MQQVQNRLHWIVLQAKAYAADLQLKQAVKDAEAARAIQSSASHANGEIQKAEQAAKLSYYKQSIRAVPVHPGHPAFPAPWNAAPLGNKPLGHAFHPY